MTFCKILVSSGNAQLTGISLFLKKFSFLEKEIPRLGLTKEALRGKRSDAGALGEGKGDS